MENQVATKEETKRIHAFVPKSTKQKLQNMMIEDGGTMTDILIQVIEKEYASREKRKAKALKK